MRKSRKDELLRFLFFYSGSEAMTIKEIAGEYETSKKAIFQPLIRERVVWPRATVFRLLEKLITEKKVIKWPDSRNEGCRGRPAFKYQVNPNRKFILRPEWLLGGKPYKRFGKTIRRLLPERKQFLKEYKQYLKK